MGSHADQEKDGSDGFYAPYLIDCFFKLLLGLALDADYDVVYTEDLVGLHDAWDVPEFLRVSSSAPSPVFIRMYAIAAIVNHLPRMARELYS